ncbi:MAG: hypothetical protein WCN92_00990 [Eubacteriales bacterium]
MKTKSLSMVFSPFIVLSHSSGCAKDDETAINSSPNTLLTESSKQPP